jgi:hypothetical protein
MGDVINKAVSSQTGRPWTLLLVMLCCGYWGMAAIQPADKAVLNQTQVMFAWDEVAGANLYDIAIQCDDGTRQAISVKSLARLIKTGLQFGHLYRWQYTAYIPKPFFFLQHSR